MLISLVSCAFLIVMGCTIRAALISCSHSRAAPPPDWPNEIYGLTYSPFRRGQSSRRKIFPTKKQIREDLSILSTLTKHIRIYSVEGTLRHIPELALEYGLKVTLGAWISKDEMRNEREIALCIELANTVPSVESVIVGNESLYRNDISAFQMLGYLNHVRNAVQVPVSTSEQWHMWIDFPELADHVDFLAVHILAFWENISMIEAPQFVNQKTAELMRLFPHKRLVVTEVGWPSKSCISRRGSSTQADQSIYLRNQLNALSLEGISYFVVEAFDQWWKTDEGVSGPRWGIFNEKRTLKVKFKDAVPDSFHWQLQVSKLLKRVDPQMLPPSISYLVLFAIFSGLMCIGFHASQPSPLVASLLMTFLWATTVMIIVGTELHELLEIAWAPQQRRLFHPVKEKNAYRPKVSIHVPCYDEPPAMVKATLDSLAELNYADFEVIVIDNNTRNPATWSPLKAHCKKLGTRFNFIHVNQIEGFKAGALNHLIPMTAHDAVIIAIVDADYCVDRNWLKHTVPHFNDPAIAVVQAPQNYRDHKDSVFKKFCYAEYRGFFNIGMVIRNDHDAIIQHGTMTLIRKSVMEELGWAQWCICEDAELGLRTLESGYSMAYVCSSYGKGLIPDTFVDFKKQRFRWAYGAIQIIKRHRRSLIVGDNVELSVAQRYYFLAGWLPWIAQSLNLLLTVAAIIWSALVILKPQQFEAWPWIFATPPILVLLLTSAKTVYLYDRLVTHNIKDALAAILAGIALYHTIAKAVLYCLVTTSIPFFRTPKKNRRPGLWRSISDAREEGLIMFLLWGAAAGVGWRSGVSDNDIRFWIAMLLVQSLPYLAAVIMAFLSSQTSKPIGDSSDALGDKPFRPY